VIFIILLKAKGFVENFSGWEKIERYCEEESNNHEAFTD
jgi:hypothetical protein